MGKPCQFCRAHEIHPDGCPVPRARALLRAIEQHSGDAEAEDSELSRLREQVRVLRESIEPLVSACEDEFGCGAGGVCSQDSGPVWGGGGKPSSITFEIVRAARQALESP